MERKWNETSLDCDGNIIVVQHPDPYRGAQFLVQSGQGIVFLAHDYEQKKHVVIKKTKYDLCNFNNRQLQAADIMNILDAYTPDETFQSFGNIYLVFECMNKRDLRHLHYEKWNEFCDYQKGAPLVADLILQLFSAVAYLHQDKLKLIHRDIKPDNILISQIADYNYLVKLGDLGHARKIPPIEIYFRQPYSMPIDLWSAGCVLAEILIPANPSKPLFDSRDPHIVSQMHYELIAATISTRFANNKLPQWKDIEKWGEYFRWILENTLKLNPNERAKAADIIQLNPFRMLNLEKYAFEEVTEPYEESVEDPRRPSDWRMKIYDKLKEFNQKRIEEILQRQNDENYHNF
uniref:Protein kinase domain-containing protein n=1 Tax=Panagrolaimus sp. ES5 TaxID=591445 RepID=A0AC34FGU6_9BILA